MTWPGFLGRLCRLGGISESEMGRTGICQSYFSYLFHKLE